RRAVQLEEELGVAGEAVALAGVAAPVAVRERGLSRRSRRLQVRRVLERLGGLDEEEPDAGGAVAPLAAAQVLRVEVRRPVQAAAVGRRAAGERGEGLSRGLGPALLAGGLVDEQQEVGDPGQAVG